MKIDFSRYNNIFLLLFRNLFFTFSLFFILELVPNIDISFLIDLNFLVFFFFLFGFLWLFFYFKKDEEYFKNKFEIYFKYSFLIGLLILFAFSLSTEYLEEAAFSGRINFIVGLITIGLGLFTLYFHRAKIAVTENIIEEKEKKEEDERCKYFEKKYKRLNNIPVLGWLFKWMYKEGWISIFLILCVFFFIYFGTQHLGQFMSVDEPKWINTRVPQLFHAIKDRNWEDTYINDKPGLLPSLLSGPVYFFLDHQEYKNNPLEYEVFLFYWRLPILLFNAALLLPIYLFTKKLLGKYQAIIVLILIALNPILIGISQIVNPDATLWGTTFLSFLSFFLYLKTNERKYIYYTGLFFGLGLITKYFISIFYLIFFLVIYLEYLFKNTNKNQFFQRCLDLMLIAGISVLIYTLLFPVNWVRPEQIIIGTFGNELLLTREPLILAVMFVLFFDLLILKEKMTKLIYQRVYIQKLLLYLFPITFFIIFVGLLINIFGDNFFFDYNEYYLTSYQRRGGNIINNSISSLYITLFSQTYFLVLGLFGFIFLLLKKIYFKAVDNLLIIAIFITIFFFILFSSIGGFLVIARYQIFLYPLYAILSSFFLVNLLTIKGKKFILISTIFLISLTTLINAKPFYLHYNNKFNINKYVVSEAWGFGGYELAQELNSLPGVEEITVWSDREGFNEFFIGNSYWRGNSNPFKKDADYLVLSFVGERIYTKALQEYREGKMSLYPTVAGETPLLQHYSEEPIKKICLNNDLYNCIFIIKKQVSTQ